MKKTSGNRVLEKKFHRRDKHLGIPSCKILRIIIKMKQGVILRNELEDRKDNFDAQAFTFERQHKKNLYVSRTEAERVFTSIEDYVDASIHGLKDNIEKSKERLTAATRNSTDKENSNKN